MTEAASVDVAVIGGGFSGAAVAYHLTRLAPGRSIAVCEPRAFLGGGLAYDNHDPAHRINVPAKRMSLLPDDEEHFARWLAAANSGADDPDIVGRDGALYPQRGVFGRYVASQIQPLVNDGHVLHIRSDVRSLQPDGQRWRLSTSSGQTLNAQFVVIATTHPPPDVPSALRPILGDPRLITDALVPGALSRIQPEDRIVIVGAGLTMADVVASLDRQGHRGSITAISRRGLRSRGHSITTSEPYGDFKTPVARASGLLKQIRSTIADAESQGVTWHAVIDAVRTDAQTFWPQLPIAERRRIVRHLRVYWDVHRFRIAPQIEDALDRRISEGSLSIVASSLTRVNATPQAITLSAASRARGEVRSFDTDHLIVTTGPGHATILATQSYLAGLAKAGHIKSDPLGLGVAVDGESHALNLHGRPQPTLLVAGPLARATFGELMGLPQVSAHALRVAGEIAAALETASASAAQLAPAK